MPEILIFLVAAVVGGLAVWLLLAGDRQQDIEDEEPRGEDVQFTTSYDDEQRREDR